MKKLETTAVSCSEVYLNMPLVEGETFAVKATTLDVARPLYEKTDTEQIVLSVLLLAWKWVGHFGMNPFTQWFKSNCCLSIRETGSSHKTISNWDIPKTAPYSVTMCNNKKIAYTKFDYLYRKAVNIFTSTGFGNNRFFESVLNLDLFTLVLHTNLIGLLCEFCTGFVNVAMSSCPKHHFLLALMVNDKSLFECRQFPLKT